MKYYYTDKNGQVCGVSSAIANLEDTEISSDDSDVQKLNPSESEIELEMTIDDPEVYKNLCNLPFYNIEDFLINKCIVATCAQNPKWYYYALHAKKARIRKKYINKIAEKAACFAKIYIKDYYTDKGE